MPGLLLEVGFLDHKKEGRRLLSEAGRDDIAEALARALIREASRRKSSTNSTNDAPLTRSRRLWGCHPLDDRP